MKKLAVVYIGWGERWPLGTLADNGDRLLFEYSSQALAQGLELSPRHLKLRPEAYGAFPAYLHRLPGLVADALPDGWGLLLMDRLFRRAGHDPLALSPLDRLAFIGERSQGALVFEPPEDLELAAGDVALLELAREAQFVLAGRDSDALRQLALLGGSPHGARPKVLVHYHPASATMSTAPAAGLQPWLVKFQAPLEHKEACAIEEAYMALASNCGLQVPESRYFDLDRKLAAFGTARFDLHGELRIPMHTMAGALHADFRLPSTDYTTFLRLTCLMTRDEREVRKAFERAVFNVVFHNRDDHTKNFCYLLGRDRRYRLAPCYDLSFSEGPHGEHQMDVCGEGREVNREHLLMLAAQAALDKRWAARAIDRIADVAGTWREEAGRRPIRAATIRRIAGAIEKNRRRMLIS